MWMLPPNILCRKHLLGEHVECHMLVGSLNKGKNLQGYIDKGLIEVQSLRERHDILAREMEIRGYKHNSLLPDFTSFETPKINTENNKKDLMARCPKCRENIELEESIE
jgi:hypothetical protein